MTAKPPRVMIATPTPGEVKTVYTKTILATMNDLAGQGIYCQFETVDSAGIAWQRNILATRFLASDCTHLFMVDSDQMFFETTCRAMLLKAKPLIGTVTAYKRFNLSQVKAAMQKGLPLEEAFQFGFDWTFYPVPGCDNWVVDNGVVEVEQIGFSAVLIERSVLETMIGRGVARQQTVSVPGIAERAYYNFFGTRVGEIDEIGEDVSFSRRWKIDCGGQLFAYVDTPMWHVGDFVYGGNFFDYLKAVSKIDKTRNNQGGVS